MERNSRLLSSVVRRQSSVSERSDEQRIGAERCKRSLDGVTIGGGSGQTMAGQHVGQHRQRGVAVRDRAH